MISTPSALLARTSPLQLRLARLGIAVVGLGSAAFVLVQAPFHPIQAWALVLLGVALAATTIRTVVHPSAISVSTLLILWLAVVLLGRTL